MNKYLKTLNRIPDDIILSIASRHIEPCDSNSCICGWAIRESLSKVSQTAAEKINTDELGLNEILLCQMLFGGSEQEWKNLFHDIDNHVSSVLDEAKSYNMYTGYSYKTITPKAELVEADFVTRLLNAVEK